MPHVVSLKSKRYRGIFTYYDKFEADRLFLSYLTPPIPYALVGKPNLWVETDNQFVLPIIGWVGGARYVTPYGIAGRAKFVTCSCAEVGNTSVRRTVSQSTPMMAMARWMAEFGDARIAFRMSYGYEPPGDLNDILLDPSFQVILRSEMLNRSANGLVPLDQIIAMRLKHMCKIDDVLEHIKTRVIANEQLDPTHIELFLKVAANQQANLTDVEVGYVRTAPDIHGGAEEAEITWKLKGRNLGSLPKAARPEDEPKQLTSDAEDAEVVDADVEVAGYEPVEFDNPKVGAQ